jgi:hypothetical protein
MNQPSDPGEFFAKWNFYDPADNANNNDPSTQSNSTPREQSPSNEFKLDAIAARGATILPYSYMGTGMASVNLFALRPDGDQEASPKH